MIVYAVSMGNGSIAKLFMAGNLPGMLVGLMIMTLCYFIRPKKGLTGVMEKGRWAWRTGLEALPGLRLIVVVLLGYSLTLVQYHAC